MIEALKSVKCYPGGRNNDLISYLRYSQKRGTIALSRPSAII